MQQAQTTIGVSIPTTRLEAQSASGWRAAIVVSNRGRNLATLTPRVTLPLGWRPLLGADPFDVPAGETSLLILSAIIPPGTPAATYPIVVQLENANGTVVRRDTASVYVVPRRVLNIPSSSGPRFARVDTTVTVDFVLRNDGNVPMVVQLDARATDGGARLRDSTRLALGVGDRAFVAVIAEPARMRSGVQHVELAARTPDGVVTASGGFDLMRVADEAATRSSLPLKLRLRAYSGTVTPAEVSGGLTGRAGSFDLVVRRPGDVSLLFGERDEYRARWIGTQGYLVAGDVVPNAGVIRDSYEMLTGFEVGARFDRVTLSSYGGRDRVLRSGVSESGLSAAVRTWRSLNLGVGAFNRLGADSGRAWRAFATFGGASPDKAVLRAELGGSAVAGSREAVGDSASNSQAIGAMAVRAQKRFRRAWFDLSAADVKPSYPGRERATQRASVGTGLRVAPGLTARAWAFHYDLDTLSTRPFAYKSDSYSAGITYRALTAEYRSDRHEAVIDGFSYERNEQAVRTSAAHSFGGGRTTLNASMESGHADTVPFYRMGGSAFHSTSAGLSSGLSVEYYTTAGSREAGGGSKTQQVSGSVMLSAQLTSRLRADVTGSQFNVLFPTTASFSTVDFKLVQTLIAGQTLALRGRAFATTIKNTIPQRTTLYLEYGLPLDIPLPGTGERRVRGKVVEGGTGRAMPGVLVRTGDYAAITNRDGKVTIAPEALVGQLSVERPEASVPLIVDKNELAAARAGTRDEVTITVVEGGRVVGRVTRYDHVTRDSVVPVTGIEGVTVTFTRGADTVRTVSLDDGSFDMQQLTPGRWTVTVSGGRVPPTYGFERETLTVDVRSGQTSTMEFRVVLRLGEFMREGGELQSSRPPE